MSKGAEPSRSVRYKDPPVAGEENVMYANNGPVNEDVVPLPPPPPPQLMPWIDTAIRAIQRKTKAFRNRFMMNPPQVIRLLFH